MKTGHENRIIRAMTSCRAEGRGALLPYFTAGFPDRTTTATLVRRAAARGADVVEIGIPYSDSIADGPVIQSSFHAALQGGFKVSDAFAMVASIRASVEIGLIAMVSYSIVRRLGLDSFMDSAVDAGFDGVIFPDVPVEEAVLPAQSARDRGLCYVGLVAPTTQPDRKADIAQQSDGFLYQVAVAGTTGERRGLSQGLEGEVAALRRISSLPICVGFGVSSPDHVRAVCAFADGAIVGSAIVRRIGDGISAGTSTANIIDDVSEFVASLAGACRPDAAGNG